MEEVVIPYSPREAFYPLHDSDKRWMVVVAHRRAGKTVACVNHLIREALTTERTDFRGAYLAPFYRQAKSVSWDYFKYFSRPIKGTTINESEMRIDFANGARIQLFGADNPDSLRGLFFDMVIADEYGDWKPSVWNFVIRPALADRQGKAIIIGTPKGRNQFWEVYNRATTSSEWLALKITASESNILLPSEYQSLKDEMTEDAWRQEMECDFDAAIPGAIWGRELYMAEQEGRITEVKYDKEVPVHTVWDLGYSDDTAIWFYQVIHGEVHVIDYYASSGKEIAHYAAQVLTKPYKFGLHHLPHDAKAKTLASGGKSIVEQLATHFEWKNMRITTNLSMMDGIQAARLMFPRVWIDKENCADGIEAIKQYQREWDEDRKIFKDKPKHDWTSHAADAFRYLAVCWQEEAKVEHKDTAIRGIHVGKTEVTLNELWESVPKTQGGRI